jgi:hypothetical protein
LVRDITLRAPRTATPARHRERQHAHESVSFSCFVSYLSECGKWPDNFCDQADNPCTTCSLCPAGSPAASAKPAGIHTVTLCQCYSATMVTDIIIPCLHFSIRTLRDSQIDAHHVYVIPFSIWTDNLNLYVKSTGLIQKANSGTGIPFRFRFICLLSDFEIRNDGATQFAGEKFFIWFHVRGELESIQLE